MRRGLSRFEILQVDGSVSGYHNVTKESVCRVDGTDMLKNTPQWVLLYVPRGRSFITDKGKCVCCLVTDTIT